MAVAARNLRLSIFAGVLWFVVWPLWSVLVVSLLASNGRRTKSSGSS